MDDSNDKPEQDEIQPDASDSRDDERKALARGIAERIKALAKAKGISAQTAMISCGVQRNFLSHMSGRGSMPAADSFMLIADYFNVTLDFLFARPVTEKEYSGTLLAFEEALMKEGISDKTFNLPTRNMFFEFILKQTSYFIKLVTHQPQPPKIKAVAKSSRVALRNVDYGKRTFAMEIAERIKSLSKGKGLTYSRALAELGYHPSFLTNMTSAGSIPVADSLLPLADYFDVSVDFLLGRTKKDVEYPRLLKGFENMLKCQGITDDSIAPEDDDLYFELLSKQTETFIRMRALRNSNDKSDSENNNTSL